tara:strand:+ start:17908 stop:20001 length:2094 start_codon:yes stop_codon:yes gene_type:complete
MKQLFQSLSTGEISITNLPIPICKSQEILIETRCSLISSGTERMLLEFGKGSFIDKAKQQPDKVKEVIDKVSTDGIFPTYQAINNKLSEPLQLGYCNVGNVIKVGSKVKGILPGDRVASNGPHGEYVNVPQNLCAKIPNNVSDESAAFTVLASIGLQGIRLADPKFGETFLVIGLGVIGLLTAQILESNGCKVLGVDPDSEKCKLANQFGIETLILNSKSNPIDWSLSKTSGIGVDGVLITAATSSNDPITLASSASRTRGRIILVGVTGLNLRRDLFYKKELTFQVSCSYGPGRYDSNYEVNGNDYPIGFVRWTENRNFQSILEALSQEKLVTDTLVSHRYKFENATQAYDLLLSKEKYLGILLEYTKKDKIASQTLTLQKKVYQNINLRPKVGFIGAGNYAKKILIPSFIKAGIQPITIVANSGASPLYIGKKFNFSSVSTDIDELFESKDIDTVVISTRHDSHAHYVNKALAKDMNVFVEKPLCLNLEELSSIERNLKNSKGRLMVGFNRRFSPLIQELKSTLDLFNEPKAFNYTCNAGFIDANHWTQDPEVGGGRLIGESCHFLDLLRYLTGTKITHINLLSAKDIKTKPDTFSIQVKFECGSIGSINYFANGSKSYSKERMEVFTSGKVFLLDNFKTLKAWGIKNFKTKRNFRQNKGQNECAKSFIKAIKDGKETPISIEEILEIHDLIINL